MHSPATHVSSQFYCGVVYNIIAYSLPYRLFYSGVEFSLTHDASLEINKTSKAPDVGVCLVNLNLAEVAAEKVSK